MVEWVIATMIQNAEFGYVNVIGIVLKPLAQYIVSQAVGGSWTVWIEPVILKVWEMHDILPVLGSPQGLKGSIPI